MTVLASLAATAVTGMLAKALPKVVETLKSRVGDEAAGKVIQSAKNSMTDDGDLVRFTQSARVEPIMLLDKRCVNVPFIQDVVHSMYNRFTAYWLLAVSLDTKIHGVSVAKRLDRFATDRDLNAATMNMIGMESRPQTGLGDFGLPFIPEIEAMRASMESQSTQTDREMWDANVIAAIDDIADDNEREKMRKEYERIQKAADTFAWNKAADAANKAADAANRAKEGYDAALAAEKEKLEQEKDAFLHNLKVSGSSVNNAAKYVEKVSNLAVGKVIDVTITEDEKSVTVPVTIRLRVAAASSSVIGQVLAVGGKDRVMLSRWRAWRAGEIRFWADFVLAMDRVDAHRAAMMKDETGYYKAVHSRNSNNRLTKILNGDGSVANASSIIVIDSRTAKELERKINGTLDQFATRQGIFGDTFSMMLAVVDQEWESVTIYTRGMPMAETLTAKDMRNPGTGDTQQIMDLLKSYGMGSSSGGNAASRF